MKKEELKLEGVREVTKDEEILYCVQDLKKLNPYIKCDSKNTKEIDGIVYIKLDDLEPMTDFDKKIFQSLNFKPDK